MTVGDGPYPDTEIAEALGVEVLARLPWDPDAAEALVSVPASARELRLAPLVRAARTLADRLATELSGTALAGTACRNCRARAAGASRRCRRRARVVADARAAALAAEAKAHSTNGNAPEEVSQ